MRTQIVVLGMHRSGTSLLSKILHELGIDMGVERIVKSKSNVFGYYEDMDFLILNQKILESANGSWNTIFKPGQLELISENYKEDIKTLIDQKNEKGIWGFKEPRTSLLINTYHKFFDNPKYIYIMRDKKEVCLSLNKRDQLSIDEAEKLYDYYNKEIQTFLQSVNLNQVLFITYENLVNESYTIIMKIKTFLNLSINQKELKKIISIPKSKKWLNISKTKFIILKKFKKIPKKIMKIIKSPIRLGFLLLENIKRGSK